MDNNTLKCPYCGKENPSDAIFCMQCGSRLKGENVKTSKKVKSTGSPVNKKFDVKVLYILIVVLLVASFAVLYYAGVFSSPKIVVKNSSQNITQSASQGKPVVDLKTAQEIKSMEDALAKNPDNHQLALDLANTLFDVEEYGEAIKYYQNYVKVHPDVPDVLVDLGVAYFYSGDFNNATKYIKRALAINPKHQIALLNMGVVEKAMGEIEIAKEYWKSAIKISPDNAIGKKAKEFLDNN